MRSIHRIVQADAQSYQAIFQEDARWRRGAADADYTARAAISARVGAFDTSARAPRKGHAPFRNRSRLDSPTSPPCTAAACEEIAVPRRRGSAKSQAVSVPGAASARPRWPIPMKPNHLESRFFLARIAQQVPSYAHVLRVDPIGAGNVARCLHLRVAVLVEDRLLTVARDQEFEARMIVHGTYWQLAPGHVPRG